MYTRDSTSLSGALGWRAWCPQATDMSGPLDNDKLLPYMFRYKIKAGRNINNLRYADDTTLMAESKEELKNLLMKVKKENEKVWLKAQHSKNKDHGIWSHHLMANRRGNNENSDTFYFCGLQNHFRW